MGATFFAGGFAFASCDSDGVVLKWDLRNGSQEVQLVGEMLYGHGRNCICYSSEENCLLTGNTDGSLTLINMVNNKVRLDSIGSVILVKKGRCRRQVYRLIHMTILSSEPYKTKYFYQ